MAQPDFGALGHFRDVFHPQRGSGLGLQDCLLDVADASEESQRADVHLLHALFYEAAAGIDVVIGELLLHLADAQPVRDQLVRIDAHLILAHGTAEIGNVYHVGNGFELLQQHPVFDGPQFHQVISGICAAQRIPIDLTRGAPVRADLRLQVLSVREIDLREPFEHLLPVPIVDGAVVEDHDHERQAENRLGAQKGHVRHSGHLNFDGNGDLLFHLFRGTPRPLSNHRDIVVGDVGVRLHRQVVK